MSDKFDMRSWFLGASSGEAESGMSGEKVGGSESKTLIDKPSEKGVLSDGVRVLGESKVLDGESKFGNVIRGSELNSVESGSLESNNTNVATQTSVAKTASRNSSRWEAWSVMNMVGRVLDGRLHMDNEVDEVNDSKNNGEVNLDADKDACQGGIGEATPENKIYININNESIELNLNDSENSGEVKLDADKDLCQGGIGEATPKNKIDININNESVKVNSSSPGEGSGLNRNVELISPEVMPMQPLESDEEFNDKHALFKPKERGEHDMAEQEGQYYVSDLVWGKVKSHPWWPGQIFSPLSATDEGVSHSKSKSYLIAYFGDETFAWNKVSKIKHLRMCFSEMEKQSKSESFCHAVQCALDEVSRRVEFGLSCVCLPPEVLDGIRFQVIKNPGIWEPSGRRAGGDNLSGASTFSPGSVLHFLESLAQNPQAKPDRLQLTMAHAQLLAYYRWKGHYVLPIYEVFRLLFKDDTPLNATEEVERLNSGPVYEVGNGVPSRKRKSASLDGSSRKPKDISDHKEGPKIKKMSLGGGRGKRKPKHLLSTSLCGEPQMVQMIATEIPTPDLVLSKLIFAAKKPIQEHDAGVPVRGFLREFRNSTCLEKNDEVNVTKNPAKRKREQTQNNDKNTLRSGKKPKNLLNTSLSAYPSTMEMIPAKIPSTDLVLMRLVLAAKMPMQGHEHIFSVAGLLREFRNSSCLEKSDKVNITMNSGEHDGELPSDFQTADTSVLEGMNDSYWTDRIIHNYTDQDQAFFKSHEHNKSSAQPDADAGIVSNLDEDINQDVIVDLDPENPSALVDESSEGYRPTTFILNFKKLEAIPSVPVLNEIFRPYGPLIESETKILSKSKCAKVVFKRHEDAETAFSSTGKYKTFGPALLSYRLYYAKKHNRANAASTNP